MTFGSLFAGIGGFDLGLTRAGWRCAWHVEQNPECREVLARHFPMVPALEDVRDAGPANLARVDLICGGFPCQDLSVAGKRAGLAGARSGLFYEMTRIVDGLRPAWILWENVPGLLSSNCGRDFAAVLVELDRIGYSGRWTTLDARYFGLAQRRRRVFGVFTRQRAAARRAAQVFALAARLQGNPPPGRTARQDVAGTLEACARGRSPDGDAGAGRLVVPALADPLSASEGRTYTHEGSTFRLHNVVPETAAHVKDNHGRGGRGELGDNLIPWPAAVAPTLDANFGDKWGQNKQHAEGGAGLFVPTVSAKWAKGSGGPAGDETQNLVVFDTTQLTHPENRSRLRPGDPSPSLSGTGQAPAVAETLRVGGRESGAGSSSDNTPLVADVGVRRLTPTECERLQGFPDGWTDGHADTHRYRMLGNAVAVPCAEWIGRRLAMDMTKPRGTE